MVSSITSGERLQLTRFLEKFSLGKETKKTNFTNIMERVGSQKEILSQSARFPGELENSAYAKYLDKVFSSETQAKFSSSGIDIQLSSAAQKILDLTSNKESDKS